MANFSVKKINLDYRQAVRRGRPASYRMTEVDTIMFSVRITGATMASAAFVRVSLCRPCLVSPTEPLPSRYCSPSLTGGLTKLCYVEDDGRNPHGSIPETTPNPLQPAPLTCM